MPNEFGPYGPIFTFISEYFYQVFIMTEAKNHVKP